jgi:hypothetical protein
MLVIFGAAVLQTRPWSPDSVAVGCVSRYEGSAQLYVAASDKARRLGPTLWSPGPKIVGALKPGDQVRFTYRGDQVGKVEKISDTCGMMLE